MPFLSLRPQPESCLLIRGHVLDVLAGMADESVHCVVTSPPYYGLRSYKCDPVIWGGSATCRHEWGENIPGDPRGGSGPNAKEAYAEGGKSVYARQVTRGNYCVKCIAWKGNLGLEPLHDCGAWAWGGELCGACYICHLVEIFREVRRVLRADGTLWVVMGDSMAASGGHTSQGRTTAIHPGASQEQYRTRNFGSTRVPRDLKGKDLMGIPARLAMALQADGWWWRNDIIWFKPNPLPESVLDRCTRSHEHILMFSKSSRYFFDALAIAELLARPDEATRKTPGKFGGADKHIEAGKQSRLHSGNEYKGTSTGTRNRRDVWVCATQSFKGAHFAVFPEKLIEPVIRAGSSEKGCCPDCGAPWVRVVQKPPKGVHLPGAGVNPRFFQDRDLAHSSERKQRAVYSDNSSKHLDAPPHEGQRRMAESTTEARKLTGSHDHLFPSPVTVGWRQGCGCPYKPPVPETVLDPFVGSGTTCLTALRLGRWAIGVDLSMAYTEMARQRIEKGGYHVVS